jgi:GNAT superfamily N-acetyltransferase
VIRIEVVVSRRDLKRFIEYPYRKYRDDPTWVPPLLVSEWEKFDPKRNPFFHHARMDLYLAVRDGQVVGRVTAIDDDNHNQTHQDNLLFFGFFEADDEVVARELFTTVEGRARQLGRDLVRGPANPTMNDGSGFQVDAFDTAPYLMMPQNPPEYPRFAEAAGYQKVMDLYAWHFDAVGGPSERLSRLADRVRRREDLTIRRANMKRLDREARILKQVYNEAWEQNWGFVKYTDAEFNHLVDELKLILEPDLALFLEIDGRTVAIAIALPDVNQVLARIRDGRLLPFGILKLLNRRRLINRGRLPILGVMPEFRNRGLELVLIDEIARRGAAKGYREGECSWVLETNTAMNRGIEAAGLQLYKTYRLYQKQV